MCGTCLHDNYNPDAEILHNHVDYTRNQEDLKFKSTQKMCLTDGICGFSGKGGGKRVGTGCINILLLILKGMNKFTQTKEKLRAPVFLSGYGSMIRSTSSNGGQAEELTLSQIK